MIDNNIYIVNAKALSTYAYNQLCNNIESLNQDELLEYEIWAIAKKIKDYGDQIEVEVYSFNINQPGSCISKELIDKKDYVCLNWSMCKYLYNTQGKLYQNVIIDYIEYLKIFSHSIIGSFFDPHKEVFIYTYDAISYIKRIDYDNGDYIIPYTDWLIKLVETDEINIDKALSII
jgi:hypothetical protein